MSSVRYFLNLSLLLLVPRNSSAEKLHHSSYLMNYDQQNSRHISVYKDISVEECVDSCRLRQRCDGISYQRLANVCFLLQDGDDPVSLFYVHQENYISGLKSEWDVQVEQKLKHSKLNITSFNYFGIKSINV